jgi:hypothetical protein
VDYVYRVLFDVPVAPGAVQFSVDATGTYLACGNGSLCTAGINAGDIIIPVDGRHGESNTFTICLPRGSFVRLYKDGNSFLLKNLRA